MAGPQQEDNRVEFQGRLEAFRQRAGALGVNVSHAGTIGIAAETITRLAKELGTTDLVIAAELEAVAPDLISALAGQRLRLNTASELSSTRDAPLGLSLARLAVAETGSVMLAEPTLADRGIGMLAATQLVLCPSDRLVESLDDAVDALRAVALQPGGGYATLVTGPSRTADIERVLTVGVQGPARVAVVFVDGLG
ncbi:MAG TPA: LUD domain-containing protein [Thermomicrobiales bacterium]|nr:LUD domain-containing protein [Thermomicrobiales bacterium]